MRVPRLWRAVAIVATSAAIAGVTGATTAVASPSRAVGITIATKSRLSKVSGHTLVVFRGKGTGSATVSGKITGATAGDTATLLAKSFGQTKYHQVGKKTLAAGGAAYTFRVSPKLATAYQVVVTAPGSTTWLGHSRASYVYVEGLGRVTGKQACTTRPVCRIKLRLFVTIPPATYRRESAKHWFLYSRLRLAASHKPPAPKFLRLDHSATASKAQRRHAFQFAVTLRFRFRIGKHDAYRWRVNFCTRDSEKADGLGLPGRHGCGDKVIKASKFYLG
jgi:hypothetical protein